MESKLDKKIIERINELWAISKERPLTPEEAAEQKELRAQYVAWFRASLRGEGNNN